MNKKSFSLIELMVSLIVISLLISAFAPVITKKLNNSTITISSAQEEISSDCVQDNADGSYNFSSDCALCTKSYCIQCSKNCATSQFLNTSQCECKECASYFTNCEECDGKKCTKCQSGYFLENGKCKACQQDCPSSKCYCDGVTRNESCPTGYYCKDDGTSVVCALKWDNCATCNSLQCLTCATTFFKKNNSCVRCSTLIAGCNTCDGNGKCLDCYLGKYLNSNGTCSSCTISNCVRCSSASKCTHCAPKYFLSSNGSRCNSCNIANCNKCKDNTNAAQCERCNGGYYLSGGSCLSCNSAISNCAYCENATSCTFCKRGYHLENGQCVENGNKWKCSDDNFIRIGNLCITRYNMGDSIYLPIPSSVTTVDASQYCYSDSQPCCWRGRTAGTCDSKASYGGCNRTVCNWDAAHEICDKFTMGNKKWRLASKEEVANWFYYSLKTGDDGLRLCKFYVDQVEEIDSCMSSIPDFCKYTMLGCTPSKIWLNEIDNIYANSIFIYKNSLEVNKYLKINSASSVRCVTEMNDDE